MFGGVILLVTMLSVVDSCCDIDEGVRFHCLAKPVEPEHFMSTF